MQPLHDDYDLHRPLSISEIRSELWATGKIWVPTAVTGLVLYSRAMISMLFLGRLGDLQLAGGSLALGFANITGYSVLSGLAMGMEPICGQAFGAQRRDLLSLSLHRTVLLLLTASIPISLLWLNVQPALVLLGQDESVASAASAFARAAIPDLLILSFLHPLRIYLRCQNIVVPVTVCSAASAALHFPLAYLLVVRLRLGVPGVALAMAWTNLNALLSLGAFVLSFPGPHRTGWVTPGADALRGWPALLRLSLPTCASVCLEWWWYELMILFCGLLARPRAALASMGILIQTTALVYVFPSALGLAASARVGYELGAARPRRARTAASVAVVSGVAVGFAALGFTFAVRGRWGRMFTADAEILRLTAAALPVAGLCELGNCPQTAACGVLRGSARPALGANINLGSFYLVGTPVALLMGFVFSFGFSGLWLGLLAAQATCAALMGWALATTDWTAQVARARELTKPPQEDHLFRDVTVNPEEGKIEGRNGGEEVGLLQPVGGGCDHKRRDDVSSADLQDL